jgi:hypothetical protein
MKRYSCDRCNLLIIEDPLDSVCHVCAEKENREKCEHFYTGPCKETHILGKLCLQCIYYEGYKRAAFDTSEKYKSTMEAKNKAIEIYRGFLDSAELIIEHIKRQDCNAYIEACESVCFHDVNNWLEKYEKEMGG